MEKEELKALVLICWLDLTKTIEEDRKGKESTWDIAEEAYRNNSAWTDYIEHYEKVYDFQELLSCLEKIENEDIDIEEREAEEVFPQLLVYFPNLTKEYRLKVEEIQNKTRAYKGCFDDILNTGV